MIKRVEQGRQSICNPDQIKQKIHAISSQLLDSENPDEALQKEVDKHLIMNFDNISLSALNQLYRIREYMYVLTDITQVLISYDNISIVEENMASHMQILKTEVMQFNSVGFCLDYAMSDQSSGYLIIQYILNKDRSRISLAFILHPIKTVCLILTLMLIIMLSCLLYRYLPLYVVILIGCFALELLFIGILCFSTYNRDANRKKINKDCRDWIITLLRSGLKDSSGYLDKKKTLLYDLKLNRDRGMSVLTLTRNGTPETYHIKYYDKNICDPGHEYKICSLFLSFLN